MRTRTIETSDEADLRPQHWHQWTDAERAAWYELRRREQARTAAEEAAEALARACGDLHTIAKVSEEFFAWHDAWMVLLEARFGRFWPQLAEAFTATMGIHDDTQFWALTGQRDIGGMDRHAERVPAHPARRRRRRSAAA